MTIYIAREESLVDHNEIKINTYLAVYQNTSGDLGFDYNTEFNSTINLEKAYYFSLKKGVIRDCRKLDLASTMKMDINNGAFIFFNPNDDFEQQAKEFEQHLIITKKNTLLEKHNRPILKNKTPSLIKFHIDSAFDIIEFKKLLSSCDCCFQTKFSEYGLYFKIYALQEINFSYIFGTEHRITEIKELPCQ
mgnify:CR=1 FL=1